MRSTRGLAKSFTVAGNAGPAAGIPPYSMGKWVGLLLVAIVGLAILGFLVDAARAIAWVLLVVCAVVLGVRMLARKR